MGRHSGDGRHDNSALIWTWRLTALVGGGGAAVLAIGLILRPFTRGSDIPWYAVAIGGAAVLMATTCRLIAMTELRYTDVPLPLPLPLPQPAAQATAVLGGGGRRRGSTRRSSGIAYVTGAFGALFILAAVAGSTDYAARPEELIVAGAGVAAIAAGFLAGPACGFTVTGTHLHVDLTVRRINVPRRLIGTFRHYGQGLDLELIDGYHVIVRVDSPIWDLTGGDYRLVSRCQARTTRRIVRLLDTVPVTADGAGSADIADTAVTRSIRFRPAVASVIFMAAAAILLVRLPDMPA